MLQELRIKNLAIIDELNLSFSKGLNILTGETGAGKSIILNAVHLLLGDKATGELIRSAEEEASVEALFDISGNRRVKETLKEKVQGSESVDDEDSFLIKRVISRSGRGKAFINGNLATLGMLLEIGEELLSLCGQHEHQSLQRVETHIDILDGFGELTGLRGEFEENFQKLASLSEEVKRIREGEERRARERELMAFQSKEIEVSGPRIGEEEALKEERGVLVHAKKLIEFADSSQEMLYGGEGSAIERIQGILNQGREAVTIDLSLSHLLKDLEMALIQLEEVALALRDYSRRTEANPLRLEEIEGRLDEIERLKRKYGPTVDEVLRFKEKVDERLQSFASDEERLFQLERALTPLQREVTSLSERLSTGRKGAASELKKIAERELSSLGMKKIVFEVAIENGPLTSTGMDRVEFLVSPNVGEKIKPLAKIASGGELSRIMLAIKKILAKVGGKQVLIFDEVDSGIGGAIAEVVGRKLKEVSRHHQVICVTHLPQIASFADSHHCVRKGMKGGRTVTTVDELERDAVVEEVARMLGGVKVTDKTRAYAREMIENAKKS
jgi:DNA repair protein RecN (Recombination protein N)